MSGTDTICDKMRQAATTTLGDAYDLARADAAAPAVVQALLNSRIVGVLLQDERVCVATLPLPQISRQFEVQLEVLWRHHQAPGADRQALIGAIDRVVAELYDLTLNDLMNLESQNPLA